jgi:putative colanic acid biosynthesis glycosyltransferase WcaI
VTRPTPLARFFIASINYAPEPTGFAPHAASLAGYLARQGHQVSVFTGFPFAPYWRRHEEDRGRLFSRHTAGGLTVYRVTHYIPRRPSSVVQRAAMEASFSAAVFAAMAAAMLGPAGRPDAVLYIGAQPAVAMMTRIVAALAHCPYFVNVNDLAAHAALDVGIVGTRLFKALDAFEFAAYRKAAGATVLCRGFEEALVTHGYPRDRIRMIRSPIDIHTIRPVPHDGRFRARYGIPDRAFVVMHAGSMGRKQGLMNVVSAARLAPSAGMCWVFVGDGEARHELEAATQAADLGGVVRYVPFQPDDMLSGMFAAADLLLVNQLSSVKDTVIPSKLLTYMAAGRPVLAAVNPGSQAAEILREADGGALVSPEDPEALSAAVQWFMAQSQEALTAFGERNRAYAEEHFDERKIVAAHEAFMLKMMGARPASAPAV